MLKTKQLLLILFVTLFVAACAEQQVIDRAPDEYRVGVGDQLRINIFGHDEMSGPFTVDPAGYISLPLIKDIKADGMTTRELEEAITNTLKPKYLQDPKVSVEVSEYRPVYILGEVRTPGKYAYIPDMTLLQAIALAGGHTYRANEDVAEVTRQHGTKVETAEIRSMDIVRPGDTIIVKRRWF